MILSYFFFTLSTMRTRRAKLLGQPAAYHVITRTVAGQHLFGATEKEVFRKILRKVAAFCGVEVLTYAVMSNHVHLLIRVPAPRPISDAELVERASLLYGHTRAQEFQHLLRHHDPREQVRVRDKLLLRMLDLSAFLKELKQRFSIWFNKTHGRFGTLWAERFKSCIIEGRRTSLETVAAYIDLNAVRAGLVADPKDYRFCGYGEACGGSKEARQGLIAVLGSASWKTAAADYRMSLFGKGSGPAALGWQGAVISDRAARRVMAQQGKLPAHEMLRCRVRYFSDGLVLGSREFVDGFFRENRSLFGVKRTSGARSNAALSTLNLATARDLRHNPIS
ncbi:MAG: transposase [Puniceicoccaceae bacterium]|nr:MAG: transposase [Puniceicoccaceae bacterium]